MISILSRIFIKDSQNFCDANVRSAYGFLCGIVGIVLNLVLFAFKMLAGTLSGSVSICADAFNNLSDAAKLLFEL